MKKIIVCGLLCLLIVLSSKELRVQPVSESTFSADRAEPEKTPVWLKPGFTYHCGDRRDPFQPLVGERVAEDERIAEGKLGSLLEEGVVPFEIDIFSLRLTGLIWDKGEAIALLQGTGKIGFILKKGKLFRENYRVIQGISGEIKGKEVYLVQGRNKVKLILREEEK